MDDIIELKKCPHLVKTVVRDLGVATWSELAEYQTQTLLKRHKLGRISLNFIHDELRKRGHPVTRIPEVRVGRALDNCGVYFVKGADLVKIGSSGFIPFRVTSLQAMSPVPLELLAWIHVPFEKDLGHHERVQHERFAELRSHGEWFRYASPLTEYIEELRTKRT